MVALTQCIFLSTLSLRRATANSGPCNGRLLHFYPRSPCGERRIPGPAGQHGFRISIHALLAESDSVTCGRYCKRYYFYPRSPCGERPCDHIPGRTDQCYFYPRSPCGERRGCLVHQLLIVGISIHALLAESDGSVHRTIDTASKFLSTLSLRRATMQSYQYAQWHSEFLSTLSLRRATCNLLVPAYNSTISIHALLAESDREPTAFRTPHHIFLSTLSLRRATRTGLTCGVGQNISIHALLAESDHHKSSQWMCHNTISIHALLAESDAAKNGSTRSNSISIHALLAESDTPSVFLHCTTYLFLSTLSLRRATYQRKIHQKSRSNFYPRSPCGERHMSGATGRIFRAFLSTLSLRRATVKRCQASDMPTISIHALLAESDLGRGEVV